MGHEDMNAGQLIMPPNGSTTSNQNAGADDVLGLGTEGENVPPTFRGQPDRQNAYFSLTEHPIADRKQEGKVDASALLVDKQMSNPLRQSEANIFSKPMNPYTVLEAKLDEMKEDEDLLFQFK